jgi:hypothetical protein
MVLQDYVAIWAQEIIPARLLELSDKEWGTCAVLVVWFLRRYLRDLWLERPVEHRRS